jgi:arylsulfatase A-like enzyme
MEKTIDMKQLTSILIFALATLIPGSALAGKKAPNILIILSDDQGWGDVGFNGCTDIPTPNLDALARDGIIFSQGYATHSYCSPSRAGLMAGRYQQRFGHENNMPYTTATAYDGFPLDELMISEVLVEEGYRTCAIGKWHLGD